MLVMLELNGVSVLIDDDDEVRTALAIAAGKMPLAELAEWLKERILYEP